MLISRLRPIIISIHLIRRMRILSQPIITLRRLGIINLSRHNLLSSPHIHQHSLLNRRPLPLPVNRSSPIRHLRLKARIHRRLNFQVRQRMLMHLLNRRSSRKHLRLNLALMPNLHYQVKSRLHSRHTLNTRNGQLMVNNPFERQSPNSPAFRAYHQAAPARTNHCEDIRSQPRQPSVRA